MCNNIIQDVIEKLSSHAEPPAKVHWGIKWSFTEVVLHETLMMFFSLSILVFTACNRTTMFGLLSILLQQKRMLLNSHCNPLLMKVIIIIIIIEEILYSLPT